MSIALSHEEIAQITGYRQAGAQLDELHRQGFCEASERTQS